MTEIRMTAIAPTEQRQRECGTCTKCCEGWLSGTIKGVPMYPGNPCRFVQIGKGCTIYEERPDICKSFRCTWIQDTNIPEWLKPNEIDAIIVNRICKETNEKFWALTEAGQPMRADVLSWVIRYCLKNKMNLQYQVKGGFSRIGTEKFEKALAVSSQIT